MTRQKNVYDTSEIPHLWYHRTQESARNKQGNLFFDGDTIYSYRTSYPIARHVTYRGKSAVLIQVNTYSVTTSQHIHGVRQAIPHGVPVFTVPNIVSYLCKEDSTTESNYQYHAKQVTGARTALDSARSKPSKAIKFQALQSAVSAANAYRDYFYPRRKPFTLPDNSAEYEAMVAARFQAQTARLATASARRNAAWAARDAQRTADAQARAERMPELIQSWRDGANPRELDYWTLNGLPVMLRLDGSEVETSKGARVPVKHALILLNIVHKVRNIGEPWHRNGRTIHVGHYELDAIAPDGTVTAGCHVITWDEIARFEPILKAAVPMPGDNAGVVA